MRYVLSVCAASAHHLKGLPQGDGLPLDTSKAKKMSEEKLRARDREKEREREINGDVD